MKNISLIVRVFLTAFLFVNFAQAQIIITSGENVTAEDLVESFLGEGVQFYNVQYQGAELAKGTFTNGLSTNLGIDGGIILTSGYASLLEGPNYSTGATGNNGLEGDDLLMWFLGTTTFDASVLSFDFIPETDTLRFKYVFGSEEYPEYVLNLYNDGFGFFISGPNPDGGNYSNKNMAIVPGSNPELPVSIGNINNVIPSYPEYYVDNTNGLTIEYDGFTVVLTAWLKVVSCEPYHLHLAIADAGDHLLDSGVVLEENSFERPKIIVQSVPYPQGVSDDLIEGCVEADLIFELPNNSYTPIEICFDIVTGPGYAVNGIDYEYIGNCITFEEGQDSVAIHIVPLLDYILEGDELIEFIIFNDLGCEIRYDTVSFVIKDYNPMTNTISPPTVVCQCMDSINLWVQVFGGMPPYSYLWEPGGYTTDTILVDPDTTTIYTVSYTDQCMETGTDTTSVTVFPFADLESFYFEAVLNPGLPFDVYGEILEDTVMVLLPPGTNPNGLIASLTTTMEWLMILVDGVYQEPGVTPNDFTNPVIYDIWSPGGHHSLWTVIAEVEVGQNEISSDEIQFFPNPAKDRIFIHEAKGFEVSWLNSMGLKLWKEKITDSQFSFDVKHYKPGVYYLKFENEQEWFVKKIVIDGNR
jgi:hypothetical protein